MKSKNIRDLTLAAVMAAMVCVGTMIVRIPSPATGGFVNAGDIFVLLCAYMLGPVFGPLTAGIGSALADLLSGYPQYIPGTLFIKAAVALCAWLLFHLLRGLLPKNLTVLARIAACLVGEIVMVLGYFAYEAVLLGYGIGATGAILGNVMQGVAGVMGAVLLAELFDHNQVMKKLMRED